MKTNNRISYIFILVAALYFPLVYFGQLSVSAYFTVAENAMKIVNYIGAFFNVTAIFLVVFNDSKTSTLSDGFMKILVIWCLWAIINSLIFSKEFGRVFKFINYGTLWATHIMFYYTLTKDGYLQNKMVVQVFVLLNVLAATMTFRMFDAMMFSFGGLKAHGFNAVYFVVCLLPWVFLVQKKWLKIFLMVLLGVAVLFSQKRTAILTLAIQISVFVILNSNNKNLFAKAITIIGLCIGGFYIFNTVNSQFLEGGITERFENIDSDNMGSRVLIWEDLLEKYANSPIIYQLFGHGCESFLEQGKYHLTAHNDYLETLYDYGLIMLIVLIIILVRLIRKIKPIYKNDSQIGIAYIESVIAFLVISMSSHLLFVHPCQVLFISAMWGYSIGITEFNNKNKKFESN